MKKKKLISLLLITLLMIAYFILSFTVIPYQKTSIIEQKIRNDIQEQNIKRVSIDLGVISDSQHNNREIEQKLQNLLYVISKNKKGAWGKTINYDINIQKEFFTQKSWKEYLKYQKKYGAILASRSEYLRAEGRLNQESIRYKNKENGSTELCSNGFFMTSSGDSFSQSEKFKLFVEYTNQKQLLIKNWNIDIFPKGEDLSKHDCFN